MSDTMMSPGPSSIEVMRQYSEAEMPRVQQDIVAERQAQLRMFSLPTEFIGASVVLICSVWPEPLHSQPFSHGGMGRKIYSVAAGSPENPAYMTVENTWDWTITQEGEGKRGNQQTPIWAGPIALDIIRHWTGDHPGNRRGKKGVGIVKGKLNKENGRFEASQEEIDALVKDQRGFLTYLVERADGFWDSGQREKVVGCREYKKALMMLGLDVVQHPWYRSKVQLYNACPYCKQKVDVSAIFCQTCRRDLADYFMDRSLIPNRSEWPGVYDEVERLTATSSDDPDGQGPKGRKRK